MVVFAGELRELREVSVGRRPDPELLIRAACGRVDAPAEDDLLRAQRAGGKEERHEELR